MRAATPADLDHLHACVVGLAADEGRDPADVVATPADLDRVLFGPTAFCRAVVAERDGVPVGCAITYLAYSTVLGRATLHLEDLYVLPGHRGGGTGRALLAHLAAQAVDQGCGRFEWWVSTDNDGARRLYAAIGAQELDGTRVVRLAGEGLAALAGQADPAP